MPTAWVAGCRAALFSTTYRRELAASSRRWAGSHAATPLAELQGLVRAQGVHPRQHRSALEEQPNSGVTQSGPDGSNTEAKELQARVPGAPAARAALHKADSKHYFMDYVAMMGTKPSA